MLSVALICVLIRRTACVVVYSYLGLCVLKKVPLLRTVKEKQGGSASHFWPTYLLHVTYGMPAHYCIPVFCLPSCLLLYSITILFIVYI